jgi:hypothetical protein
MARNVVLGRGAPTLKPVPLTCGVTLHFKQYDAEMDHAASREAQEQMRDIDGDWKISTWEKFYYAALAKEIVGDWEGVLGPDLQPATCTRENIDLLLREVPGASAEFRMMYNAELNRWHREGEAFGVSPTGTTDEAPASAETATT